MKFIFQVHLRPGHAAEEYAEVWIRASEILQRAPGARGTLLHRKIGDPRTLLAIASWDSKAARDAREEFLAPDSAMREVLDAHLGIVDFELVGEFEEPEWSVAPDLPGASDAAIDRMEVIDTIARFGRALDDQDWPALRRCLAAELDVDYSSFRGTPPARIAADEFVAQRRTGLAGLVTQHLAEGHVVQLDGDAALCRCDFAIRRWPRDPSDGRFLHSYGTYHYGLRRTADGWEISSIVQAVSRSEGDRELHGALRQGGR